MIDEKKYSEFVNYLVKKDISSELVKEQMSVHASLGIAGESGEVVDLVKKKVVYNRSIGTGKFVDEIGDLLHYIQILCNSLGITMNECITKNMEKLNIRYPNGYSDDFANNKDKDKELDIFK